MAEHRVADIATVYHMLTGSGMAFLDPLDLAQYEIVDVPAESAEVYGIDPEAAGMRIYFWDAEIYAVRDLAEARLMLCRDLDRDIAFTEDHLPHAHRWRVVPAPEGTPPRIGCVLAADPAA